MNINSITFQPHDKIKEITSHMTEYHTDILGLAETNCHWNNGDVYRGIKTRIRKQLKDNRAQLYTSDTDVKWKSRHKRGGTAIITTGRITPQVTDKSNDYPLGRWSSFTIGPKTHQITIITAYIVC